MYHSLTVVVCFYITLIYANESTENVKNISSQKYDTIVVGLGSSGVTAATTLARAGRRVLGLEAQNRIGGRVRTVPISSGVVELGAEWIHGERPSRVYDLAIQNNVSIIPDQVKLQVFKPDGSPGDHKLINDLLMYVIESIKWHSDKSESLGNLITEKLTGYIKEKYPEVFNDKDFLDNFLKLLNLMINTEESTNDWNDVNTKNKYEDLEGYLYLSWHKHGYKTFFEILLNEYDNGPGLPSLDIKINTEVTKITWPQEPNEPVVVTTKDGASYTADNVIVTPSVGVLKERHSSLFSPQLPQEKVTAIENIALGVTDKVVLLFPEAWWTNNTSMFAFLWNAEEKGKVAKEDYWTTQICGASRPLGSDYTLALWVTGETAKLIETLPDDVVLRKSMDLIRRFLGRNTTIPEPIKMIRSTWYSNPYTRGSYSYDGHSIVTYPDARNTLAKPLVDRSGTPRVLFAGEATNEKHHGTVHGASDTGYRESMRILSQNSTI